MKETEPARANAADADAPTGRIADQAALPERRASIAAGILCLLIACAVALVVLTRERILLPVTLDLPGAVPGASDPSPRFEFAGVDLGMAVILLLMFSATMRIAYRIPGSRWIERGLATPITLFLIAGLNGITDAGSLIAIYSLTSAMVLFDIAQLRARRLSATSPWALGTMVGIVPWGIIALHQVGGGLAGHPAPVTVQVITMTVLVLSAGASYAFWRERAGRMTAQWHIALSTTTTCLFAVEAAALIVTA